MSRTSPASRKKTSATLPLHAVREHEYSAWLKAQPDMSRAWLSSTGFEAKAGAYSLLPGKNGALAGVVCVTANEPDIWAIAALPAQLPVRRYALAGSFTAAEATQLALGWELACYRFTRYKKTPPEFPKLLMPKGADAAFVRSMSDATYWARDLINTPANDMHPAALAQEAANWAKLHKGSVAIIKGDALKKGFPMVHTVGQAAAVPPQLVDIRFARKGAPKVTLVGKGVCFDSGGLDIKSSGNMKMMKKDMGGAAAVLALAKVMVDMKLPVQLRVLIPCVENAVSGEAMRPLDIVRTRKGITVEIGNTDAEGRLILCDALSAAEEEKPDLIIDCATLTGAARVALGTELPAFFTPSDELAENMARHAMRQADPMWRLPLWKNYRKQLDTPAAELSNDPDSSFGGAITAALYLQEFVSTTPNWLHIDMMAWNLASKPGRPQGGEAMAVRALYAFLKDRYGTGQRR